ncbi:hypothetical protein BZA05DRAFT_410606 [Tricharina praecox]|uniref:uncharacterized protein n=1 Tax=Tricharina praecox TaxID=43433 RepID=UPI00221F2F5B|nr:uncharacterized protein BZA05DRAFT_410606 [Tricharina praecox]KAI5843776.1 hypothetical protein BZA05DRAFT_410606 [Tricharina praecox]
MRGVPTLAGPLPINSTSYCNRTSTVTYGARWDPLFTENDYTCEFPPRSPLALLAPHSSATAGQHGADGTLETSAVKRLQQLVLQPKPKRRVPSYGCTLLPSPAHMNFENGCGLIPSMRRMSNRTCILPDEVQESAAWRWRGMDDWRFVVVNRGEEEWCEWWQEIANIAHALHYVCIFSGVMSSHPGKDGTVEAIAWGADEEKGLRWCLRYSERGWGEQLFDELCLGV